MKTKLHYYRFNIDNELEHREYLTLCETLKGMGLKKFDSISSNQYDWYKNTIKPLSDTEIELETDHLFDNQWNTGPVVTSKQGLRVFDWAEPIYPNSSIKEGQWLEQTDEMRESYFLPAMRGEKIACFCLTEPEAGSDLGNVNTIAAKSDDGYVINGMKTWVTNGPVADFFTVLYQTDPAKSSVGKSAQKIIQEGTPYRNHRFNSSSGDGVLFLIQDRRLVRLSHAGAKPSSQDDSLINSFHLPNTLTKSYNGKARRSPISLKCRHLSRR